MSGFTNYLATHRKAIVGGVLTGASAAVASMIAGGTWQVALVAAVAGALGVGAIPNRTAKKA